MGNGFWQAEELSLLRKGRASPDFDAEQELRPVPRSIPTGWQGNAKLKRHGKSWENPISIRFCPHRICIPSCVPQNALLPYHGPHQKPGHIPSSLTARKGGLRCYPMAAPEPRLRRQKEPLKHNLASLMLWHVRTEAQMKDTRLYPKVVRKNHNASCHGFRIIRIAGIRQRSKYLLKAAWAL